MCPAYHQALGVENCTLHPPSWDISEPIAFLINLLGFPIFPLLPLNLYISREDLVHRRKFTLVQPLGKASVSAKYQTSLYWVFYDNLLFHLVIFSRSIKRSLPSQWPSQPTVPHPRFLTWPPSRLQECTGHRVALEWALSSIRVLLHLRGTSVRCFKVYPASVSMPKR